MISLTIFTPTYNRAYTIGKLFESLIQQDNYQFEWIVVDDGSNDNTSELFLTFLKTEKFPVKYIKVANGGKHRAVNTGVNIASGELFFIVDSDDYLTHDAVKTILVEWELVRQNSCVGGICFRKAYISSGQKIGQDFPEYRFDSDSIEVNYKYKVTGDKAEIFRTSVLKQFPFPEIKMESFVPEALVWNRIAGKYKLRFVDQSIYLCEYLPDGLSRNFSANLQNNPKSFALYYGENMLSHRIPVFARLKFLIRYFQCQLYKIIG